MSLWHGAWLSTWTTLALPLSLTSSDGRTVFGVAKSHERPTERVLTDFLERTLHNVATNPPLNDSFSNNILHHGVNK
jgi:hypothetical protein